VLFADGAVVGVANSVRGSGSSSKVAVGGTGEGMGVAVAGMRVSVGTSVVEGEHAAITPQLIRRSQRSVLTVPRTVVLQPDRWSIPRYSQSSRAHLPRRRSQCYRRARQIVQRGIQPILDLQTDRRQVKP